ncbi:uncharacterized protein V1510DRAFT_412364 [Dipodascopsis tothii]|uniref:uncharacterized protein n=1 Tax=Dipodascopsis tothii TaxID=44089 RepID=UPI0034CE21DC
MWAVAFLTPLLVRLTCGAPRPAVPVLAHDLIVRPCGAKLATEGSITSRRRVAMGPGAVCFAYPGRGAVRRTRRAFVTCQITCPSRPST